MLIRYGYNCVIYGWDPTCMMGHEWIRNMNVHSLPHGHHQPFYNVLVEDGSCRYAAQGEWPVLVCTFHDTWVDFKHTLGHSDTVGTVISFQWLTVGPIFSQ